MSEFEITVKKAKDEGYPEPIWWAIACRQLGISYERVPVKTDGLTSSIKIVLPEMDPETFWRTQQRAELLAQREADGLPTEEKPSGGFPDSDDEVADPVAFKVGAEDDSVVLDFGRPIRAVKVHPQTAMYLATLLTQAAFQADVELGKSRTKDMSIQVATVTDEDGVAREAVVKLPCPFGAEDEIEVDDGGDHND